MSSKVLVLVLLMAARAQQSMVEVTLKQGVISGSRVEPSDSYVFYSFKTIPYAKPPVGFLRFKDPEPAPAWSGVRNGSLPFPMCPQANFVAPGKVLGQEDCLYLNVYTPKLNSTMRLPVMVYIHGGGFVLGSAEDLTGSPRPLLQNNVVLVTINYRLGLLGFLSTGDSVLPGNLGLKDQTLALRWVRDNIMDFGGDPNLVTIFGVSAGATSAHLQILSPSSAGLFQRAILQSGTALLPNFFLSAREGAIAYSKFLNCTSEESSQILACFTDTTTETLVNVLSNATKDWLSKPVQLGPCVDGTFLPFHPAILLRDGYYNKVDVMSGITRDDGNVITGGLFAEQWIKADDLAKDFMKIAPVMLMMSEEENPDYLTMRILFRDMNYKANLNITKSDESALTKVATDRLFKTPSAQTIEFHAKDRDNKIFMYQFDHNPEKSLMSVYLNFTQERPMAGHGDDILYLFDIPEPLGPMKRHQDLHMQEILTTLWTNFAATGNPTVNGTLGFRWIPVAAEGPLQYISLSVTPTMQLFDTRESEFWNSLPTKVNKLLYPKRFLKD